MSSSLRLVLGDQLSQEISSLSDVDREDDVVLMCEVREEATYVGHHKKKIAFLFSAMRHFADDLTQAGHEVWYVKYDHEANGNSFKEVAKEVLKNQRFEQVVVTSPGEYRLSKEFGTWEEELGLTVKIRSDNRFFCSTPQFLDWASGKKQLRMESFYRMMRKTHDILMDGDKPLGGKWNYDKENRKPPKMEMDIPPTFSSPKDATTVEVIRLVENTFQNHFGNLEPFPYAVTRQGALEALELFIAERLPLFGDYQDAMLSGQPWMYHAHISMYLNCGLLSPRECVKAAEDALHSGHAPINAVEGFIRQILGWREFIRGIYWLKMPEYAEGNYLDAHRSLPDFYWTGETPMNCLHQVVKETRDNAYAHHIQRLMVLGNFALLAGIDPKDVSEWFLAVYSDAYEWVELPNVYGMALYADGGGVASKPYAASGAYINRMSDYCKGCAYDVRQKTGDEACPFNYLYWNFLIESQDKLRDNPRMGLIYKALERMQSTQVDKIQESAAQFFKGLHTA